MVWLVLDDESLSMFWNHGCSFGGDPKSHPFLSLLSSLLLMDDDELVDAKDPAFDDPSSS